jgi:hypothetical protein
MSLKCLSNLPKRWRSPTEEYRPVAIEEYGGEQDEKLMEIKSKRAHLPGSSAGHKVIMFSLITFIVCQNLYIWYHTLSKKSALPHCK